MTFNNLYAHQSSSEEAEVSYPHNFSNSPRYELDFTYIYFILQCFNMYKVADCSHLVLLRTDPRALILLNWSKMWPLNMEGNPDKVK